jgi:hypothetical protein
MKKMLILVVLLVVAASCTAPTENTNRVATTNANTEAKPAAAPMTEADAIAKEKAAWDMFKQKDYDGYANLLAPESIYVGPDGVFDKEANLKSARDYELTEATFSDWKYLSIDKDIALVTYTANAKGKMGGKEQPAQTVRASSVWVNRDGKWLAMYHQESLVKPPAATPTPKAAPKTTASPATTPAPLTTSSDAEANEKAIWDALKAKNWDGFGSALAPESIEVEPEGVSDKAGSVKMVSTVDFSKATTSEFKTVKLTPDASLVTYLVKIPGVAPNGERHTTIWANRSGKWLAVFHQGSPVMAGPPPAAKASPSAPAKASPTPAK